MAQVSIPVDAGNEAAESGSLAEVLQGTVDRWKPESFYATTLDGKRTIFIVFEMTDSSDSSVFAEPLFRGLGADVQIGPAMNLDDLERAGQRV